MPWRKKVDAEIEKRTDKKKQKLDPEEAQRKLQMKILTQSAKRTAGTSVFDSEIKEAVTKTTGDAPKSMDAGYVTMRATRVPEHMERALNPDPQWRHRWLRKKTMQMVRKNGRLTKDEKIQLSERELRYQSEPLPTSVKKLMLLSRQLAGKTVGRAITQMRYTKKKMGPDLVYILKEARDRAVVERGMGLGRQGNEILDKTKKIQDRDGKWMYVRDPTRLYIDQAWVGKGPWRGARPNFHGRGRQSLMWSPSTRELSRDALDTKVVSADTDHRYRVHSEGGEDANSEVRGEEGQGGQGEAVGASSEPAHHLTEAVLQLVACTWDVEAPILERATAAHAVHMCNITHTLSSWS
jgi:ribosomal protein L22